MPELRSSQAKMKITIQIQCDRGLTKRRITAQSNTQRYRMQHMQEAHECEKCGEMFPANQLQLKCAGFADSGKHVAEPAPSVARSKALPQFTKSSYTELSTTSGRGERARLQAEMDEDAPRCHKPAEVTHVPGPPKRMTSPSAFYQRSHVIIYADIPKRQSMKQRVQCSAGALGSPGTGRVMQRSKPSGQ